MQSHSICMCAIFPNVKLQMSSQITHLNRCKVTIDAVCEISPLWFSNSIPTPKIDRNRRLGVKTVKNAKLTSRELRMLFRLGGVLILNLKTLKSKRHWLTYLMNDKVTYWAVLDSYKNCKDKNESIFRPNRKISFVLCTIGSLIDYLIGFSGNTSSCPQWGNWSLIVVDSLKYFLANLNRITSYWNEQKSLFLLWIVFGAPHCYIAINVHYENWLVGG